MNNFISIFNIILLIGIFLALYPMINNLGRILGYHISRWIYPMHKIEIRRIHDNQQIGEPIIIELSSKEPLVRQLRMAKGNKRNGK